MYEHKNFCNWFKAVEVVPIPLHPIIQFSFMFIVYRLLIAPGIIDNLIKYFISSWFLLTFF